MEIILRATALFLFVWVLMRVMGKRELAELTAFELVLLISIGDLIQQGVTQEDMSITGAFLAVGTIGMWILVFSYASFRWKSTRSVIEGLPVVVVRDGELLDEMLRIERLTRDEVFEAMREQGIEAMDEVRIGILEADGKFSFITGKQHAQQDRRAE
jgi:uncharacterized membrane protein YcaP (DUF421 family)